MPSDHHRVSNSEMLCRIQYSKLSQPNKISGFVPDMQRAMPCSSVSAPPWYFTQLVVDADALANDRRARINIYRPDCQAIGREFKR